ncbi:O-antigen ligase family protein [Pseudorhodoplanes sinuspersici]|uniref:O-antigen ligase-related domain-containing protein n=1 Tax=Pseudorhodoplanes sinuspersici TaxID=1235591 RepID=A0A1W6ZW88_9HYPH|nr:O-antigen ligase family protein [Pseudorhodoplanes sinuspersici]ARQ01576.1 hypothetical protein CAK95_22550 [Pseudorhodoplanes sinuspersici]RKE73286.1 O-antigen ligase-like membrane protein [Pseudorhodoplanes sinuspersici]
MITLDQARRLTDEQSVKSASRARRPATDITPSRPVSRGATQILEFFLFLTILVSCFVFIEPSPYEFAMGPLAFGCLIAGVTIRRELLPMIWLLLLWNIGGAIAYFRVSDIDLTDRFVIITLFMAMSAIIFASLFSTDSVRRLRIMRIAYIIAALVAATAGIIGYFNLTAGLGELFAPGGRARGPFKDPNVYGPFLILPILFLLQSLLSRGLRILPTAILLVILFGFFLSFSRGAWIHFVLSGVIMLGLMIVTAENHRTRLRLILLGAVCVGLLAAAMAAALSFDAIANMFKERAQAVQSYDVGSGGRFTMQILALTEVLNYPFGMGPFAFSEAYGIQQHNVYLQAFLVYGWIGGLAYIALIVLTLIAGLGAALKRTPWQPYLIAVYATFVGEVGEGIVIDTDHWRHFFLLLGVIWGLVAASRDFKRRLA